DRNPDDTQLYARLAAFVEQNKLDAEVEDVYRRAIARFPSRNWYHALARWYLRGERQSEFEKLTREAVSVFSGTELEEYFRDTGSLNGVNANLYLRINLYAHERFPLDLVFVKNLLASYSTSPTTNWTAYDKLLRTYWYYDETLRRTLLGHLAA